MREKMIEQLTTEPHYRNIQFMDDPLAWQYPKYLSTWANNFKTLGNGRWECWPNMPKIIEVEDQERMYHAILVLMIKCSATIEICAKSEKKMIQQLSTNRGLQHYFTNAVTLAKATTLELPERQSMSIFNKTTDQMKNTKDTVKRTSISKRRDNQERKDTIVSNTVPVNQLNTLEVMRELSIAQELPGNEGIKPRTQSMIRKSSLSSSERKRRDSKLAETTITTIGNSNDEGKIKEKLQHLGLADSNITDTKNDYNKRKSIRVRHPFQGNETLHRQDIIGELNSSKKVSRVSMKGDIKLTKRTMSLAKLDGLLTPVVPAAPSSGFVGWTTNKARASIRKSRNSIVSWTQDAGAASYDAEATMT